VAAGWGEEYVAICGAESSRMPRLTKGYSARGEGGGRGGGRQGEEEEEELVGCLVTIGHRQQAEYKCPSVTRLLILISDT
jgi:hypothetical protein